MHTEIPASRPAKNPQALFPQKGNRDLPRLGQVENLPQKEKGKAQIAGALALNQTLTSFVSQAAEQQILGVLAGNEAPFKHYKSEDLAKIRVNEDDCLSSQAILNKIEEKIRITEQLQHTMPQWNYSRLDPKPDTAEKVIIKIEHQPGQKLTKEQRQEKRHYSLMTRKLSIMAGILTLLDHEDFITQDANKKQAIREYLAKQINALDKQSSTSVNKDFNAFVLTLTEDIAKIAAIKEAEIQPKVLTPIREAERYFTAEHQKNMVLMVISPQEDGPDLIQLDLGLNHRLTEEQKKAYQQIHKDPKPLWFTVLRPEEQAWYQERIPHISSDAKVWTEFEGLFKPSAMQHSPGLANARVNCLIERDAQGKVKLLSQSLKCGTPVTYEVPARGRLIHTQANSQQLLKEAEILAENNFKRLWGSVFIKPKTAPPKPILVQSLLSPKVEASLLPSGLAKVNLDNADQDLISQQEEAMQGIQSKPGFKILYHNNGTNILARSSEIEVNLDVKLTELRISSKNFLESVAKQTNNQELTQQLSLFYTGLNKVSKKETLKAIEKAINGSNALNDEQKFNLKLMVNIENELRRLAKTSTQTNYLTKTHRNREEYLIALKKMLVDAMGGVSSNNCKSGKDRTGHSEVYQHALYLYAKNHEGSIPAYCAKGKERKEFCEFLVLLTASMKIQAAASWNTPGSPGTKAPEICFMVDTDVVEKLNDQGDIFNLGCKLASLNKPDTFKSNEGKKMKDLAAMDNAPSPSQVENLPPNLKQTDLKKKITTCREESIETWNMPGSQPPSLGAR